MQWPLCDVSLVRNGQESNLRGLLADSRVATECVTTPPPFLGAEDGARTRDIYLGKVVLYQLSYFRISFVEDRGIEPRTLPCKGSVFPLALVPQAEGGGGLLPRLAGIRPGRAFVFQGLDGSRPRARPPRWAGQSCYHTYMKIVVPHVDEPNQILVDSIRQSALLFGGFDPDEDVEFLDVSVTHQAYSRLLCYFIWMTLATESLIICEHDIIAWPGAFQDLDDCPNDWCMFPYMIRGELQAGALGLTKFGPEARASLKETYVGYGSPDTIDRRQTVWDKVAEGCRIIDPFHYSVQDAFIFFALKMDGFEPCIHLPAVFHMNQHQSLTLDQMWERYEAETGKKPYGGNVPVSEEFPLKGPFTRKSQRVRPNFYPPFELHIPEEERPPLR